MEIVLNNDLINWDVDQILENKNYIYTKYVHNQPENMTDVQPQFMFNILVICDKKETKYLEFFIYYFGFK